MPTGTHTVRVAVNDYLRRCFRNGEAPHIAELAAALHCKPLSLSRRFHALTGVLLSEYMRSRQVAQARRLLRWTRLALCDVARRSGFQTERSFFRAFRRLTGTSPLQYREKSVGGQTHR